MLADVRLLAMLPALPLPRAEPQRNDDGEALVSYIPHRLNGQSPNYPSPL
jgi:hypothetical protein